MKNNFFKELPLMFIVALPLAYLGFIWNSLPEVVPVHWDLHGVANGWGSKYELILIPLLAPVFTYVVFIVVPILDPKKRIEAMGSKFYQLKFIVVSFMSALATYIIYSAAAQTTTEFNYVAVFLGILFAIMGNYFQSIKPNYFIGIRTPWTLENETVWRKTHQFGGKMWLAGGIIAVLCGLFLKESVNIFIFISITVIITIIPVIYSYIVFKDINKAAFSNGFKE